MSDVNLNSGIESQSLDSNNMKVIAIMMHELRTFNKMIRSNADSMTRLLQEDNFSAKKIRQHADEVFDNSYSISLWLDICDYEFNPEFFATQIKSPRSLHGKISKAVRSFKRISKSEKLSISFSGSSYTQFDAYPIIEILPYVLLDNAVKYAPRDTSIDINIFDDVNSLGFSISSIGPLLEEDEVSLVKNKGIRGKYAALYRKQGFGLGLSIAEFICDIHDAKINIKSEDSLFNINMVPFSQFTVTVSFGK